MSGKENFIKAHLLYKHIDRYSNECFMPAKAKKTAFFRSFVLF